MDTHKLSLSELPDVLQKISSGDTSTQFLVFTYPREDIFEEVYKRTSIIGKHRTNKEGTQNMLNTLALTKDDDDIFESFLYDAAARVFECFTAFTKRHTGSYLCLAESGINVFDEAKAYAVDDKVVYSGKVYICINAKQALTSWIASDWKELPDYFYTDNRVTYVVEYVYPFNSNYVQPIGNAIYEAIVNYIIYKWFLIVWTGGEAPIHYNEYLRNIDIIREDLQKWMSVVIPERKYNPLS